MIQISVVSGKGGTGKTVITGALAALLAGRAVVADCDVDAANLSLLMQPEEMEAEKFYGMDKAEIEPEVCIRCGNCFNNCRFKAIIITGNDIQVNPLKCEGCGVCEYVCPADAVKMIAHISGEIRSGRSRYGPFIDGALYPGSGNSGLMVHKIRKKARESASNFPVVLIDGPPGIGCPLISTVTGCDLTILVTEPGSSGRHDLERLVTVCSSLHLRMVMIINRADFVPEGTLLLRKYAKEWNIPVICEIPFDPVVIEATRKGIPFSLLECQPAQDVIHAMNFLRGEFSEL